MQKIKFVYFDVGGVVVLDFSKTNKWQDLQQELGITQDKSQEFLELFKKYKREICIDRDVNSLLPIFESHFGISVSKDYSLLVDGFIKRYNKNPSLWSVIKKIKERCKIGLLTNMYVGMLQAIKKNQLLPDVTWDVIIDSSEVKTKKPDIEIYKLAEKKLNAHPKKFCL